MIDVQRTFTVAKTLDVVVEYLKDFAHAEAWDPGTQSCVQESTGPVAVGTTWHNVSKIRGKETELTYRLEELTSERLVFVGKNDTATSTDQLSFAPDGAGTAISYHAEIEFHGLAKLATPFLKSEFEKLGDQTAEQMTRVINAL